MRKYVVVENAGYEGECDVRSFNDYWAAVKWINRHYGRGEDSEQETLHVQVRRDGSDGSSEYV